jgi:hypothetical protein
MRVHGTTPLLVASAMVVSMAHSGASAAAPPADTHGLSITTATGKFLTPLPRSLFLPPDDPRVIQACSPVADHYHHCPKFLRYGSPATGGGPFLPPVFKAETPNLLVTFTLYDMKNVLVQGVGIDSDNVEINLLFAFDSSASSVESPPGPSGNPPDPGPYTVFYDVETHPGETTDFNAVIWQALITDGCNNPPPVIPIDFLNHIDVEFEGGTYHAMDNTSLTSTGFWNFEYTKTATDTNSGAPERLWDRSAFTFRGKVSVMCTGLEGL